MPAWFYSFSRYLGRRRWSGYGLAVAIGSLAFVARLILQPLLGDEAPFITVLPATVIVAMFFGFGPAIITGFLSDLLIDYYITPPLGITFNTATITRQIIVIASSGLVGWFGTMLRKTVAKFKAVYDQAAVGIGIADLDGKFLDVNEPLCKMLGYRHNELTNLHIQQITDPQDYATESSALEDLIAGRTVSYTNEKRLMHRKGETIWVRMTSSVARTDRPFLVRIIEDVSDRKRARIELEKKDHLLESANKELAAIIGFISHDLRTPLVNISGFGNELSKDSARLSQLIAKIEASSEVKKDALQISTKYIPESVSFIETSAKFMNSVLQSLVQVARAGLQTASPEKIDMNELIKLSLKTLETLAKQSSVQIEVSDLPACSADKTQVGQVFVNLLSNAIKYLDPARPGQIRISGSTENGESIYVVEDNGVGIDPANCDKIFEMFSRLEDKNVGGEGIGLAIVKRMLARNNGRIWVESEKGRGSRFFVALPCVANNK
jgi:PAS domain S-box-containing protein